MGRSASIHATIKPSTFSPTYAVRFAGTVTGDRVVIPVSCHGKRSKAVLAVD